MNEKPLYDIDLSHLMIPGDKRLMDDDTMYVRGVRYDVDMNTYTRHGTEWDTDTTATDKFGLIINGVRVIGSPTDPIQYIDCNFAKDSKIVVEIKGDWGAYQVIEGADAQSFTVDEHCNPKDKFGEFDRFALVRKENLKCSSGIDEDGVAYTTCNTRPPYLQ
jgi:hypothetical protein